jgi:hypothetical protein
MENQNAQEVATELYDHAANLLVNGKSSSQVKEALIEKGLSEAGAVTIVSDLENQIKAAKKDQANKDMLYGALWCIGGTIATIAEIGFVFWGAILFGGIQFIKGAVNSFSAR